ncbi:MAG: 3-carboxy-cis,cis-muconate cycloisomerase [Streptosporangiales bacterium]
MRQYSSPSDRAPYGGLLDQLSGDAEVDRELSDAGWLQALLDVEAALVRAQASTGMVAAGDVVEQVDRACRADAYDPAEIGRAALAAGNPVVPLVRELESRVPEAARPYIHRGATSQDVLDTAVVLLCGRSLQPLLARLDACCDAMAALADAHRATPMPARTLLQQALPTTFGLVTAGWLAAVSDARDELSRTAGRLRLQFGGAAGTLASLGDQGLLVIAALSRELGLPQPVLPWDTDRQRIVGFGSSLGTVLGALGKVATDIALLAQTEVGEVREGAAGGRGGSSTLPHKQNPVGSVLARAAAARAPGLVATLAGCMVQEHQRAAGAWHAEWEPLRELLHLAGGAAGNVQAALDGLQVDTEQMRANLDRTGGLLLAEAVTARLGPSLGRQAAHDLVQHLSRDAAARGVPFRDVLLDDERVREHLGEAGVDAALDPAAYLGSADAFVDRALAAYRERS